MFISPLYYLVLEKVIKIQLFSERTSKTNGYQNQHYLLKTSVLLAHTNKELLNNKKY